MLTLPVELWHEIIRYATHVQGAFDSYYVSPIDAPLHETKQFPRRHFISLRTKSAIVSVSSTWRAIGLPYLYETVIVDPRKLGLELDAVALMLAPRGASHPGYGHYVRRFDISISIFDNPENLYARLTEVYTICPNIEIWKLEANRLPPISHDWLSPMFTLPRHSLRSFTYCDIGHGGCALQAHLANMPNLEYLHIDTIERPRPDHANAALPRLHTLSITNKWEVTRSMLSIAAGWRLDGLKHVAADVHPGAVEFLERHIDHIEALTLHAPHKLADTLERCTSLEDVVYHHFTSEMYFGKPVSFVRIGLSFSDEMRSSISTIENALHRHFLLLTNPVTYPHLKVIRLLDLQPHHLPSARRSLSPGALEFWSYWIPRWGVRNVRLEDSRGEVIELGSEHIVVVDPEPPSSWGFYPQLPGSDDSEEGSDDYSDGDSLDDTSEYISSH